MDDSAWEELNAEESESVISFTSDRGTKDLRGSGDEGGRGEEDACSRATGSGGGGELDTGIEEGGGAWLCGDDNGGKEEDWSMRVQSERSARVVRHVHSLQSSSCEAVGV